MKRPKPPEPPRMSDLEAAAEFLWFFRSQLVTMIERSRTTSPQAPIEGTEFVLIDSASMGRMIGLYDQAVADVFAAALPPLLAHAYEQPPPLPPHPSHGAPRPALRVI
jgi:hypothetical protein